MNYFSKLYILAYIMHIFLGPYFIWYFLFDNRPVKCWENNTTLLKRLFFISYLNLLLIAYFNEKPDIELFVISMAISLITFFVFIYKWWDTEWRKHNSDFYYGIVDHFVFFVVPLLVFYKIYNLDITQYKPGAKTLIGVIYLYLMKSIDQIIYKGGKDI
tara:strand:- start:2265 stop:2741 length:477 start_codon:yes stop_codon:yes gene_type:complete